MDRIGIIRTEAQRIADVLSETDPDVRCPTCPDWSAADLLWHVTEVHYFWAAILARNACSEADLASVEQSKPVRPAAVADLLELRAKATAALVGQLERLDDDVVRWSWWEPDQTVGFTRRMQTYEATMHRVDAELAAGLSISAIGPEVAAGAVDHAIDVMWGWQPADTTHEPHAVVEFLSTDTGQRWLIQVGRAGDWPRAVRARNTAAATATARGSVADLALWAWGRGGSVELSGASESLAALRAVVSNGMQ
ncbi:maleylpyruvate isomerase family mycothiol-dependent enzyme [Mycobacterium sp. LTG2003]